MSQVTEELYKNLCSHFNRVCDRILGKDYYNMGDDVYSTHMLASMDLIKKYEDTKNERDRLKKWKDRLEVLLYLACFGFFGVLIMLLSLLVR